MSEPAAAPLTFHELFRLIGQLVFVPPPTGKEIELSGDLQRLIASGLRSNVLKTELNRRKAHPKLMCGRCNLCETHCYCNDDGLCHQDSGNADAFGSLTCTECLILRKARGVDINAHGEPAVAQSQNQPEPPLRTRQEASCVDPNPSQQSPETTETHQELPTHLL